MNISSSSMLKDSSLGRVELMVAEYYYQDVVRSLSNRIACPRLKRCCNRHMAPNLMCVAVRDTAPPLCGKSSSEVTDTKRKEMIPS